MQDISTLAHVQCFNYHVVLHCACAAGVRVPQSGVHPVPVRERRRAGGALSGGEGAGAGGDHQDADTQDPSRDQPQG